MILHSDQIHPKVRAKGLKGFVGNVAYQLAFFLALGSVLGVLFRFYPKQMSAFYISPQNFKFLGNLFISLVRMLVGPLVFASVFTSIVAIEDTRKTSRLFGFSIFVFLAMTLVSVLISIFVITKAKVGVGVHIDTASLMDQASVAKFASGAVDLRSFGDFVLAMVPSNITEAFRTDNFLHLIFFATAAAFASMSIGGKAAPFVGFVGSLSELMLRLSAAFSKIAPLGIFGFVFWIVGTQDIVLLKSLFRFVMIVYGVCIFLAWVLYPAFAMLVMRLNPIHMIKKLFPLQFMAYFLSSSSAVLPTTLRLAEEKLGVSNEKAMFVIPIGATLNMNGGAVYISASTIFVAQLFGVDLTAGQYVLLAILATIAAVGTAPIPGSSIFLLAGVLLSLNLPVAAIGILLAIDRVLDMIRTATNVTGDVFSSMIISFFYKDFKKDIYDSK